MNNNIKNKDSDKDVLKPKTLRVSDYTIGRFRGLAEELGVNQNHLINTLVDSYKLEQSKNYIPGKKDLIEEFQNHLNRSTEIMISILENNLHVEDMVKHKYESTLMEKTEENKKIENTLVSKEKKLQHYKEEYDTLSKELNRVKNDLDTTRELNLKNNDLIDELKRKVHLLEKQSFDSKESKEEVNHLKEELQQNKNDLAAKNLELKTKEVELNGLTTQINFFTQQLETIRSQHKESIESLKKANEDEKLKLKKSYEEKLNKQKEFLQRAFERD